MSALVTSTLVGYFPRSNCAPTRRPALVFVEANIHYLLLYPDVGSNRFNEVFLRNTRNVLVDIVPADADFAGDVRVIHVPEVAGCCTLTVAMDGETDVAVAFLK